jgi:hypothetical protein
MCGGHSYYLAVSTAFVDQSVSKVTLILKLNKFAFVWGCYMDYDREIQGGLGDKKGFF